MSNIYRHSNRKKILLTNLDRNRKGLPIRFEELESRLAPATLTWSGLGTDTNWSTGKNWIGNVAPTGLAADNDDLVFPGSPIIKTTNNDLTSAVVNSISISGSTYTLAGKQLTLGLPIVGSGSFNVNAGSSGDIISPNLGLGAATGSDQTFRIAERITSMPRGSRPTEFQPLFCARDFPMVVADEPSECFRPPWFRQRNPL